MDRQYLLVSTRQPHRLEIGLELKFCSRVCVERAAERRSEPFLGLRHRIDSEYCWMRAGFLFPLLRLVGTARALVRALLFLVALLMLALGQQTPLLLLAVIQRRCRKSDIEISCSEIIRARIVLFPPQRFLQSFDRIWRQRLDRKERTRRRSALSFPAILFEQRKRLLNTHDTRNAPPAFSARAEGSQPDDLARAIEQGPPSISWVNGDVRHDGVRL